MSKGIILYESKYGATKKYAQWLVEMTGFDLEQTGKFDSKKIAGYEKIILCGGIYASGISGSSFLRKNSELVKNKKTAVFCVGASPFDEKAVQEIRVHNLKGELKDIPLFYGRGAWNLDKMSFKDRTLCKLLQKATAKKDPALYEPWEEALMCAGKENCDWTDKAYLQPLLDYILG